ncbi:MAG: efflux RND transporter periplasmic adaptor subunit [Candidatus Eremiobacteraeota bacterium]|nr:efflux RND transporter periplasmic adaptor subunit [Candidatus Eremiobacteraeota bacterium]
MDEDIKKLKRRRKIRNILIIIIIILLVGSGIAYYFIRKKEGGEIVYTTEKLEKGKVVATVSSTGSLSAVTTVDVGSQVSGIILDIFADYNDRVSENQVIARIDPATFLAQLLQATARLNSGKAQFTQSQADLDNSRINVHNAEAGVHQAQAGISKAQAQLQNAQGAYLSSKANRAKSQAELDNRIAEYKRAKELFKQELISLSEKENSEMLYKVALAALESAKANVESAKANIKSAKSGLSSSRSSLQAAIAKKSSAKAQVRASQAKVNSALASIQQAQGDVEQVQINVNRCTIKSPVNGIVIDRKVDVGQTVAASFQAPVLFQIAKSLEKMEVKASVDEADIGKVKKGQKVKFTVDAFPDDVFHGKVYQVRTSPNIDQNVVTYDVIIRTDNNKMKLKPGMTANTDITVEVKKNVLKLPNSALRFRPDKIPNFPYPEDVKKEMKEKKNGKKKKETPLKGQKPGKDGGKPKLDSSVWVLKNKKPILVKIATGISDNTYSEVKAGDLKEGMEVITEAMTHSQSVEKKKRKKMRVRL